MITLENITFNHDAANAHRDALSIRRNAAHAITMPEWRRGATIASEDCPAAYALNPTRGQTLTVRATFRRSDPALSSISIRTFNPRDTRAAGCIYAILERLGAKFVWRPPPPVLNILGEVAVTVVSFANDTVTLELPLHETQIWSRGVGVYHDAWNWQYSTDGSQWVDFETSRYKVYVIVDLPQAPWSQVAGSSSLPWTEALDLACEWARGAGDADAAGAGVTRGVNALGSSVFRYDCPGGGASHYTTGGMFDCTSFLDRVRGGPGLGQFVNCTDCATFVTTFANLVGAQLWASRMGWGFGLNPILAIGAATWWPGCQNWSNPGFSYHEVAWTGACTESERIFDACLHVDGDSNPAAPPHVPRLPTNVVFRDYRPQLSNQVANCLAQPDTRLRRPVV